jgi:predicted GIY-YIG superfamily endonuclease
MEPLVINSLIYVLECEEGKYYIGITYNLNLRLAQHLSGSGAKWTRLYKPKRVVEIIHSGCSLALENETTQRYITLYGRENVRGGSWCKLPSLPSSC